MTDLQLLLKAIARDLGDPTTWSAPVEFPNSLALCALNSAYSLRATSASAKNVLARYRAVRPTADSDSGPDLLQAMDDVGGPSNFAGGILCNDSKLPGTTRLRTEGIYEGLTRLAALDAAVTSAKDLRAAAVDGIASAKNAWCSVIGFGPLSWSYLLMNAGVGTETKPDVMVQRYLARALGEDHMLTPARARQLLELAAAELAVEPRALDRAIWLHESPSSPNG
ncbi:hypothetical protein ACLH0K_05075 [Arthrobacter sp. MPF02]|uniref:hypothetical protein n=1 Tax=Arthrobacter sp. MPF02 TaxID=3388492 RepID=UPI003985598E